MLENLNILNLVLGIGASIAVIVGALVAFAKPVRRPAQRIARWVKARTIDRVTEWIQAPRREIEQLKSRVADLESQVAQEEDPLAQLQERLHRLTEAEQEVLRPYVSEATRTQYLHMTDGVVAGLEVEKVIYRPVPFFQLGLPCAFNMQPWAYTYLTEHPDLVGLPARASTAGADSLVKVGDRIEVLDGPATGKQGTVLAANDDGKIAVKLDEPEHFPEPIAHLVGAADKMVLDLGQYRVL